jgi:LuxR family maltose regulon positive regulatory protein
VSDAPSVLRADRLAQAQPDRMPRLRRGTVRRERLLRRLRHTAHVPVALVVAPAGYGKTTLLAHWLQADRRPAAWHTVTAADDGDRLVASIARAVDEPADLTLAALAYALERRDEPFVLVLDDVHRLRSRAALAVVAAIIDAVPAGSQVVLAGRAEPALPIGRLRAHGRLLDLRTQDLVMTRREAARLLGQAGLELQQREVGTLLDRTEGWPACLYLAALSLRERTDVARGVARFAGDDRLVADYLCDELLDALDAQERAFLLRASVLDELSGPLCDAVLGRSGSGAVLRDMSRANVPLVPLDATDGRYRCHRLLAEMLRAELRRADPALEARLHRRASRWYAESGDADRALAHAIAGQDVAVAGSLLWTTVAPRVLDGRAEEVRRWLDRFTAKQVAAHPTLALTAAAHHLVAGERDLTEHWAAAAERTLAGDASLRAATRLMRAVVARDGISAMRRDAERAYMSTPEDSPWRPLCALLRGIALHLGGDPGRARRQLEEGARRGAISAPLVQALCLAQLALLALDERDPERAELLAGRARSQVERIGLDGHPPCALVFAVSALVRAHRDVEEAQADRRRATALLGRLVDYAAWYDVELRVVMARAALRLGDVIGARALLVAATRELEGDDDAGLLRTWIDELTAQVEAFTATELVAPSALTTAELRILSLMPTHLSFREIGRRLYISANTVKTHAHAVYRKLDVSSRSDAVLRARSMGLLDA